MERLPSLPESQPEEDDLQDIIDLLAQGYMMRDNKFFEMRSLKHQMVQV